MSKLAAASSCLSACGSGMEKREIFTDVVFIYKV